MTQPGENVWAIVLYATDEGEVITISQKASVAAALGNWTTRTRTNQGTPERWKLRTITLQTIFNGKIWKREYVIGTAKNAYFAGERSTVEIDGVTWRVTSRRGERRIGPYLSNGS